MFNVGGWEVLVIFVLALVVLGPTELPRAVRQVGKVVGEFRRISTSFQRDFETAIKDPISTVTREPSAKLVKDSTTGSKAEPSTMGKGAEGAEAATDDDGPEVVEDPQGEADLWGQPSDAEPTVEDDSLDRDAPLAPADDSDSERDNDEANSDTTASSEAGAPPMYGDR